MRKGRKYVLKSQNAAVTVKAVLYIVSPFFRIYGLLILPVAGGNALKQKKRM